MNAAGADHEQTVRRPASPDGPSSPSARILAVDGPAGAGKSTIATAMAERFGLLNLETGAMYRAFAVKALQRQLSPDDSAALSALTSVTSIELTPGASGSRVLLDGEDVTARLRSPEISQAASRVSIHAPVRAWMVHLQQQLGRLVLAEQAVSGIVMEGRDIGTVVFPDAGLKIFLSASAEARATRRVEQAGQTVQSGQIGSGGDGALSATLAAIRERDQRDQTREVSPLRAAEDAVMIDSTTLSLEEVIARVTGLVTERWGLTPVIQ
jgi:cytidylate kinase